MLLITLSHGFSATVLRALRCPRALMLASAAARSADVCEKDRREKEKKRDRESIFFSEISFLKSDPVQTPYTPPERGGGRPVGVPASPQHIRHFWKWDPDFWAMGPRSLAVAFLWAFSG